MGQDAQQWPNEESGVVRELLLWIRETERVFVESERIGIFELNLVWGDFGAHKAVENPIAGLFVQQQQLQDFTDHRKSVLLWGVPDKETATRFLLLATEEWIHLQGDDREHAGGQGGGEQDCLSLLKVR